MRTREFLKDALPIVLLGVLGINLLYTTHVFPILAEAFSPFLSRWLGVTWGSYFSFALGFLRKDLAMSLFIPLQLSVKQLIISSVMLAMFFPCVATFVVILRELGWKKAS